MTTDEEGTFEPDLLHPTVIEGKKEPTIKPGEVDSFIEIYRYYRRSVRAYLTARIGNTQDAEDVTALVFEQVWISLSRYQPQPTGSFKGWLFTIARRALADYYRQPKNHSTQSVEVLAEQISDPAITPEETVMKTEENRRVLQMLYSLKPGQQEVLSLRFLAELPYAEIARVTGKSEANVKMIAYRALEALRRRYPKDVF